MTITTEFAETAKIIVAVPTRSEVGRQPNGGCCRTVPKNYE